MSYAPKHRRCRRARCMWITRLTVLKYPYPPDITAYQRCARCGDQREL